MCLEDEAWEYNFDGRVDSVHAYLFRSNQYKIFLREFCAYLPSAAEYVEAITIMGVHGNDHQTDLDDWAIFGINEYFTKACMIALCSCRLWNLHILRTQGYIYLRAILERYHFSPWRQWKLQHGEPEHSVIEWEQFGKTFSRNTLAQNMAGVISTHCTIASELSSATSIENSLDTSPGSFTNWLRMEDRYRLATQDVTSKRVNQQIHTVDLNYQWLRSLNVLTVESLGLTGLRIHDRILVTLLPALQNLQALSLGFLQMDLGICKWDEVLAVLYDLPKLTNVNLRGLAYGDPPARQDTRLFWRPRPNTELTRPNLQRPRDIGLEAAGHIGCHRSMTTIMCSNREEDYSAVKDIRWAYSNDEKDLMDFCFHGDILEKRMIQPRQRD